METETAEKKPFYKRLRKPGKQAFWLWVGYQAIKGTCTTVFIWAPLIMAWWHAHS